MPEPGGFAVIIVQASIDTVLRARQVREMAAVRVSLSRLGRSKHNTVNKTNRRLQLHRAWGQAHSRTRPATSQHTATEATHNFVLGFGHGASFLVDIASQTICSFAKHADIQSHSTKRGTHRGSSDRSPCCVRAAAAAPPRTPLQDHANRQKKKTLKKAKREPYLVLLATILSSEVLTVGSTQSG